jgi:hypothetical protein
MSKLLELKRPEAPPSLKEVADNLQKHIADGDITGCVVLCVGPGKDDALLYAEGGHFDIGTILYAFEQWKRLALDGAP